MAAAWQGPGMKATDCRGRPGGSVWGLVLYMTCSYPSGAGVRELCVYVSRPVHISAYMYKRTGWSPLPCCCGMLPSGLCSLW